MKDLRNGFPLRSIHVRLSVSICAFTLLFCAFNIRPSFAQQNLDWRYHGNTLDNERFQDVDQINPSNVSRLKPAWIFHTGVLGDPSMSMEMTPVVVNGVMYVPTGDDDVFARGCRDRQADLGLSSDRHACAVDASHLLQ